MRQNRTEQAPGGRRRGTVIGVGLAVTGLVAAGLLASGVASAVLPEAAPSGTTTPAQPLSASELRFAERLRGAFASGSLPAVPQEYAATIISAAATCPGLSPTLLAAQLEVESTWNPRAVSYAGAEGLAQFLPSTWEMFGMDGNGNGTADPFEPEDAIYSAARYDCDLLARTARVPGDPYANMFAAYHAGPGAVVEAGGVPPIPATQAYVVRIIATVQRYAGS